MKLLLTKIAENKKIADGFYKMRLESAYLARTSRPGQFVEVRCPGGQDVLLRRPLGVHRISKRGIELLYEVVGKGTEILSRRKAGETLDLIGPLGNGFDTSPGRQVTRSHVLVGGGIGVAPLLALAESLAYSVERIAYRKRTKIDVFIGACKKEHILCEREFKRLGAKVFIATDNGSKGNKGYVTDLLSDYLYAIRYPLSAVLYACGPVGMLKEVARIAKARGAKCQVSLEERMACGVGVCLGCPVKVRTSNEYKMVCKDGPVFDAEEVAW